MNRSVCSFYDAWRKRYIRTGLDSQCYVWSKDATTSLCVSEGQGYGMVTVALMAGYDPVAHQTYDSLYRYFKAHTLKLNPYLMGWAQNDEFLNIENDAATDGDMDIAYSLLLADVQWGSKVNGLGIDYKGEALKMISAIEAEEINLSTFSILKSNATKVDSKKREYFEMRSSDFMPAHFKVFFNASGNNIWTKVISNNYALFDTMQNKYSAKAGFLPDYIKNTDEDPSPKRGQCDGGPCNSYGYNACRVPWRIATDYLLYGDKNSKNLLKRINKWVIDYTNNDPQRISPGYNLQGKGDITQDEHEKFAAVNYLAPFAVSAMVDSSNHYWLNKLWMSMLSYDIKNFDYYSNTIKMLDMIIVSGNYWKPSYTNQQLVHIK
jgi:endo-1,4-beta-D-glucanase Y